MNIVNIIAKKRDGHILSKDEINFFITSLVKHEIKDYHASALLMAIYLNGMNYQETLYLTNAMLHSGETINLKDIKGMKIDKHSTGGVGDKTSLVLLPLVASFDVKVAKISGRGLGHTGGTLDKLESIPGMNINLEINEFKNNVKKINIAMMGQTQDLDPADKILYALRDVTATVGCLPLIASSIMSKKLAVDSDAILLDVKLGSGAFMKTIKEARALSQLLVKIGKDFKRDTRAIITNMQEPLGLAVGNNLEVKEAIMTLHNKGPKDFTELCVRCAAIILMQKGLTDNYKDALKLAKQNLENGKAYEKFKQWINAQGGDISYLDHPDKFKESKYCFEIKANKSGYIKEILALNVGEIAMHLGAGRLNMTDKIDYTAGILLKKKVGDKVKKGETVCLTYTNKNNVKSILKDLETAFIISKEKVITPKVVLDYIK